VPELAESDLAPQIGIVILAAGASTRFGSPKQLASVDGAPLLQRAMDAANSCGHGPVVVVLGAHHEQIMKEIRMTGRSVVFAHDWESGLSASIRAGVRQTLDESPLINAILLMLADQPAVNRDSLLKLISSHDGSETTIAASHYSGQLGVPAIFGRRYFDELLSLTGSGGAKTLIKQHASCVRSVELPEAAIDVDTLGDLQRHEQS
jgi:molybdenum cofactor cytidylyltransferase